MNFVCLGPHICSPGIAVHFDSSVFAPLTGKHIHDYTIPKDIESSSSLSFPPGLMFSRPPWECLSYSLTSRNGVRCRSVLSLTLLPISINGLVKAAEASNTASLHVDVVAIYYSSRSFVTIERRLQGAINRLSRSAWRNVFLFFPDKRNIYISRA
jgi:hypothetical protein